MKPSAIYRNGEVFWRGSGDVLTYRPLAEAIRLRDQFARTLKTDWFYATAQRFAADLTRAINQAQRDAEFVAEQHVGMLEAV